MKQDFVDIVKDLREKARLMRDLKREASQEHNGDYGTAEDALLVAANTIEDLI